jgi:hypothetical protein
MIIIFTTIYQYGDNKHKHQSKYQDRFYIKIKYVHFSICFRLGYISEKWFSIIIRTSDFSLPESHILFALYPAYPECFVPVHYVGIISQLIAFIVDKDTVVFLFMGYVRSYHISMYKVILNNRTTRTRVILTTAPPITLWALMVNNFCFIGHPLKQFRRKPFNLWFFI